MKFHIAGKNNSGRAFLVLLLAAVAAFILPPPTVSAADDDGFLISLPTEKEERDKTGKPGSESAAREEANKLPAQKKPSFQAEDMLQGVVYDIRDLKERSKANGVLSVVRSDYVPNPLPLMKQFVLGDWKHVTDKKGVESFPALEQYGTASAPLYQSFFYRKPAAKSTRNTVESNVILMPTGRATIYTGYVVAPFTGTFRFCGFGEEALVVRFNNRIVLDYGDFSLTTGTWFEEHDDFLSVFGGSPKTAEQKRMIRNSPVYSQCNLETYFTDYFKGHGIAKGLPIGVKEGQVYPIEIMHCGNPGSSGVVLMTEYLDSYGKSSKNVIDRLPLFRTSEDLPEQSYGNEIPEFDPDSPVWKIVDAKGNPFPVRGNSRTRASASSTTTRDTRRSYQDYNEQTVRSPFKKLTSASDRSGMLQGVVYDLKLTRDRKPISDSSSSRDILRQDLKPLLNGTWKRKYAKNGAVQFVDLEKYYASPTQFVTSNILVHKEVKSADVPKLFLCGSEVKPSLCVCIFSGFVTAPFSGKFRFVGGCDDVLLVRFDNNIVLDYGKVTLTGTGNYYTGVCKANNGADLGQGVPIEVTKGKVYPIEILVADLGGTFSLCLYYEKLNAKGEAKKTMEYSLFPSPVLLDPNQRYMYLNIDQNAQSWKLINPSDVKVSSKK